MPAAAALDWQLRRSRLQNRLDALALLILLITCGAVFGVWAAMALAVVILLTGGCLRRFVRPVVRLRLNTPSGTAVPLLRLHTQDLADWQLIRDDGSCTSVRWRVGSVRRSQVLLLRYGIWPWQGLIIRPDCFANPQDYRTLMRALYGNPALG